MPGVFRLLSTDEGINWQVVDTDAETNLSESTLP